MLTESTAGDFLTLTEASQLLTAERLAAYRRVVGAADPASAAATRLVQDGLLTLFQAKVLLKGRPQGFFLTSKYKILDHLGTGGMGRVYLCEHLILQRLVAVKVLLTGGWDPEAIQGATERFHREARAVAALDHPNIARVFDVDSARGSPFMVMEYVDGVDLHRYVEAHGALEPNRAAHYAAQAADGLHHAHRAGLVHRDVKPSNLILDRAGTVRLLDLGLARFRVEAHKNRGVTERYDSKVVLGTADFMAPEQAVDSSRVDTRADVYSLGCTLYFLLTGKLVFDTDVLAQKMMAHQMRQPVPVRTHAPAVPEALEAVLARMMAKKPEDRFQTPGEAAAALREFAAPPPGPPLSKSMPKLAARSYRLGLCPVPAQPPAGGTASTVSSVRQGSGQWTASPTHAYVPRSAAQQPVPRADSGAIRVGPVSQAALDTPGDRTAATRNLTRPEPAPAPGTAAKTLPYPKLLIAGLLGLLGSVLLGVLFWPEPKPSATAPPRAPAAPAPTPKNGPDPVAGPVVTLAGGGSSFARPIMDHWTELYKKPGVAVTYAGVGSSKGIEGVIAGTYAFGCTDAPMTAAQLKQVADSGREVRHVPIVLGAVVPVYNLPEVVGERLVFTGPVLADVYLGKITHWDDEAILANNPAAKAKLTHRPIVVTHRSDGSGTTFIWTDYLSAYSPRWAADVGKGTTVKWPAGKGAPKSEGVTDLVNATPGAIGYVEISHALQLNLPYGLVKNRQGTVVPPTFENITAAAASLGGAVPDDLVFSLVDRRGGDAGDRPYPITGATWALLPLGKDGKPDPHAIEFLDWATHDGQKYATDLRYAPLPKNFSDKIDALFYRLKR
jgi:phosphate ABC transporter phosphate-binding protein